MGLATSTLKLVVPCNAPSALGITGAGSSHASDIGSTNIGDYSGATTGRSEPSATMTSLPALVANSVARGGHENADGRAVG
jgi:hypothetical protein